MRRRLGALVLVVLACCGGGSTGSASDTESVGKYCADFAEVICDKVADCSAPAPPDCASELKAACCSGTTCSSELPIIDEIEECFDQIRDMTCGEFQGGAGLDCR